MTGRRGAAVQRRRNLLSWAVAALLVAVVVAAGLVLLRGARTTPLVTERCTATVEGASHDLRPEQAGNAALITAVAVRRGLPARAATIAVATSIQESGLRNLDYGDRDSVGLFQQRPSQGWGTAEEIRDPLYATNAFYDALVQIEDYQALEITVASDLVQRSAFPNAVADHEPEGRAYASALTGNSPGALVCRLRPAGSDGPQEVGEGGLTPRADAVVATARTEFGELEARPTGPGADGAQGVAVTVSVAAGSDRSAWALGQWAVASADRLDVVAVTVGGSTWRRADVEAGWVDTDAAAAPGEVVVEVS